MSWKKSVWWGFGLVVLLGLAIQGVPYGRVYAVESRAPGACLGPACDPSAGRSRVLRLS